MLAFKFFGVFATITLYSLLLSANTKDWDFLKSSELSSKLELLPTPFVLLQVWNTSCEPCGEEVQELNNALQKSKQTLSVVGIPIQSRKRDINAFLEHFKPQYDQLFPSRALENGLVTKQKGIPWNILFDRKRIVVKTWVGKITSSEILTEISTKLFNKEKP